MSSEEKIEIIKWHQRIQEVAYLEAGQHMRALNQLMWQVPSLVIAINGGLWYGTTLVSELAARAIFFMVFIFDLMSIITLYRLRGLLEVKINFQKDVEEQCAEGVLSEASLLHFNEIYLRKMMLNDLRESRRKELESKKGKLSCFFEKVFSFFKAHSSGNYTVIGCWSTVLFLCSIISLVAFVMPQKFIDKTENPVKYEIKNLKNGDIITVIKQ
jgi:hypothetical protein